MTSSSRSYILSTATQGWVTGLGKRLLWGSQNGLDWVWGLDTRLGLSDLRRYPFPGALEGRSCASPSARDEAVHTGSRISPFLLGLLDGS